MPVLSLQVPEKEPQNAICVYGCGAAFTNEMKTCFFLFLFHVEQCRDLEGSLEVIENDTIR